MKLTKKLITILIAITLVFNFIIIDNFNVYANTVENTDKNKRTNIISTDENPIYKGLNIKEYSPKENINSKSSVQTFKSLEEAVTFFRAEMVNRKGNISFILEDTTYYDGIWKDILYSSMEDYENNTSSEGDYLNRHYSSCKVGYIRYSDTKTEFEYEMSYLSTYEQEEQVDRAIKKVLKDLGIEEKDDYTKIKLIHDYIVENIRYDYTYNNYSAYNAIIDKSVVCQGFSSLTYKMFKEAGLKVRIITGTANGGGHAWNIVKLGDSWYNIDNTWDSCYSESGPLSYEWFLKDKYNFPDHTRDSEYNTTEFNKNYPMATTAYNHIIATGITLDKYSISMNKGDTQILKATISPSDATNKNIIWKSSNENIATVDENGKVSAVGIGEATITAISTGGTNLKVTCKVIVKQIQIGWLNLNGTWYYLDGSGAMVTGWINLNGTWYYLNDSGEMQTGWINLNGTWYYLDESGAMATGWLNLNGIWYYLDGSGAMVRGWLNENGIWYYLDESGAMMTGWLLINGKWYYMYNSGEMATNTIIDGWKIDGNGVATPII